METDELHGSVQPVKLERYCLKAGIHSVSLYSGINSGGKCCQANYGDPVAFSRQDEKRWFAMACLYGAVLDFLGSLSHPSTDLG